VLDVKLGNDDCSAVAQARGIERRPFHFCHRFFAERSR
jgi:hypothetical protein